MSEGEDERSASGSEEQDEAFEYDDEDGMEDEEEVMDQEDEDYDDPSFGAKKRKIGGKPKERRESGGVMKKKKCKSTKLQVVPTDENSHCRLPRSTRKVRFIRRRLRGEVPQEEVLCEDWRRFEWRRLTFDPRWIR
jgi:hypothetical protein